MRFLFLLTVFLFNIIALPAQSFIQTNPDPAAAGFDKERLTRLDNYFKEQIEKERAPGIAVLIVRNGKVAYHKAFGYNDDEKKQPLDKNAIFRIASQTKAITSTAIMMLYDEGKFLLNDPVSKYIPEFANARVIDKFNLEDTSFTTVPAKRQVTIHDLLTHTSGIGYAFIGSKEANALYAKHNITAGIGIRSGDLARDMRTLGTLPLFHQPGEKWTYGLNTDILGYLVEVLSGQTLDEFFRKRIFEPLEMNDTYFLIPKEKAHRLATLFIPDSTGKFKAYREGILGDMDGNYPLGSLKYYSGGGGLSSTLLDYAKFLQMYLNEGEYNGKRLLAKNTVRMILSNQIGGLNLGFNKFGLGFFLVEPADAAKTPWNPGTFGWGGAFATSYWADPKEKLIGLLYKQIWGDPNGEIAEYFKVLTYQAINN
jgi:CubicO group peptidase (beta-lactamase class C family)